MTHRVLKYRRTVIDLNTEKPSTVLCPFTREHATEAGTVLETDGIPIDHAITLCTKWNRITQQLPYVDNQEVIYSIPFIRRKYTDA